MELLANSPFGGWAVVGGTPWAALLQVFDSQRRLVAEGPEAELSDCPSPARGSSQPVSLLQQRRAVAARQGLPAFREAAILGCKA
jgi:hypothetical protein